MTEDDLRRLAPSSLSVARAQAHRASQLLTLAARANLTPVTDDSHTNLGWDQDTKQFLSWPLPEGGGDIVVALTLQPLRLELLNGSESLAALDLAGRSYDAALTWLDDILVGNGLQSASSAGLPYDLPPEVEAVATFEPQTIATELGVLATWFDLADRVLTQFAGTIADLSPGPGPVRTWPHHFDIATYVQLETGDFEAARGIGVGMSPGDESYGQPYFYINPWPHLDAFDLPEAPAPGHWHTAGFVGAIATGDEVLSLKTIEPGLGTFISTAFGIGRQRLGV